MTIFYILFYSAFLLIFGIVLFSLVNSFLRWRKNNNSPRITVSATVVTKRMDYRRGGVHSREMNMHHVGYTDYYATFQFESGDRLELPVDGEQYGMLVEGDFGKLTFQGTRYISFIR